MITEACSVTIDADTLPCAIVSIADNGRVIVVNQYLCELLGYTKEALHDVPVEVLFTISTKIFYQTHFFPLVKLHNKAEEVFFSLKSKDGSAVPVIGYANRVNQQVQCVFVPVRQRRKYEEEILQAKKAAEAALEKNETLTELKNQAELQLAESDRQLSMLRQFNEEYIGLNKIISHDLHEPIRKLMVHLDLLLAEEVIDKNKLETSLRKMMEFCRRLRQLTVSLQQYVSIDVEKESLTEIDVEQVIRKAFEVSFKEEGCPEAEIEIDHIPVLQGYHSQIERLFCEVISNCFKFREENLPLKISVTSTEFSYNIYKEIKDKYKYINFVRIEVEDNGCGFLEEYNEYIFGLFKRIRLDKDGSGFGLALCKKIVERHHGNISARSGNGKTIVSILLPLNQAGM